MKPVDLETLILPLIGWIYDFNKDNKRLPDSLEDLAANKSEKRDYNPGRAIARDQENGVSFVYQAKADTGFEIKIAKGNDTAVYDSTADTLSFYRDDGLQYQVKLN